MFKKAALGLGALALVGVTSACENSQGGPSRNQTIGALTGAALGAAAGTLVGGNDRRNALVGAGVGLLAGAAVGTYLDRQQAELEQNLAGSGANVSRVGDTLLVTLPGGVTFDTDSANIRPEFRRPLREVAFTLNDYPESYVDVIGHTDSVGAESYNQALSERRAQSVASSLIADGVNRVRIAAYGKGETQPVASNDTAAGRQANRRVEIVIIPATRN
jgi:outer membrane protein OmpA-like peptidoglycan-associated protein